MSSLTPSRNTMEQTGQKKNRVFVVLDVTSDHKPALQSAAALAARLDASMVALFVEQGQLEDLEGHPLVRAVDLPTGMGRSIEIGSMRRSWRAMARRMHRRLALLSRRYQIETRIETIGGDLRDQLEQRTESSDLFVVSSSGRTVTRHVRMASRGHAVGRGLSAPVVFVGDQPRQVRSVAVVYDGSDQARGGVETAIRLATKPPALLTLLLVADSSEEAGEMQEEIGEMLRSRGARVRPHVRRITCCNTDEIVHVAEHVHANFVIIPGNDDYPGGDDIDDLTGRLDCPVLVMRGGQ